VFAAAAPLRVKEGGILPGALFLPSYVTDRESGSHALDYRVTSVSDDRLVVVLDNRTMSLQALQGAPPSVEVEVEASDGLDTARGTFEVEVERANGAPSVAPVGPQTARVGELFSLNLSAADPDGDLVLWSDASGLVDVSGGGRIQFTPTSDQVGAHTVTVTASDGRLARSTTFLLVVVEVERDIDVRNPPVVRAWPGQEVVIDLFAISPDPDVIFVPQSAGVTVDNATRTLHYTPSPGEPRFETLILTAVKGGLPSRQVAVSVDVAAAPAGGAEVAAFAFAGIAAAGLVGFTLVRAHSARLKDERMFRIEGKRDGAADKRSREEE
jgi:hypothetical protein